MYEFDRVEHLKAEPEIIDTPSASGKGQRIARCPVCKVAVWSNYPGAGPAMRFVRVGTMPASLASGVLQVKSALQVA